MTPYAHILDAIQAAEEAGVILDMSDFLAMAELIEDDETKDKEE